MKSLKEIFFECIESYNLTITSDKRKDKKSKMSFEERRGIVYNTLRRLLIYNFAHRINFKHFSVKGILPTFNEDGTLNQLTLHPNSKFENRWWVDDNTTELSKELSALSKGFDILGKTKEQMQLCDIVNSVKNYKL